jgi:ATP-dependent DNA ligase
MPPVRRRSGTLDGAPRVGMVQNRDLPTIPSWLSLTFMPAPEPMLSVSARRWPDGGRWVLQPKWDGFRLLIDIGRGGGVRGWSRHGTDLTARLGLLLGGFADVACGTTFDGELVVVTERDGKPAQDFATVTRAVFTGQAAATERLRFVAFDLLAVDGEDVRARPWEDRDARLRETLPLASGSAWPSRSPRPLRRTRRSWLWGSRAPC